MVKVEDLLTQINDSLDSDDIIVRQFRAANIPVAVAYVDGMTDKELLERCVIAPITDDGEFRPDKSYLDCLLTFIEEIEEAESVQEASETIAAGDVILLVEGMEKPIKLSLKKFEHRSITEPPTETVLRGPREGFVENVRTNITLLRRRIKSPNLRIKEFKVGRYSNTTVVLAYVEGIVDLNIVEKIEKKINEIDIDGVIGEAYIDRFVEINSRSIFNQTGVTEKPDILAAKLMEGRVAIMMDGSPVVSTVPYMLFESFQDSYDYYIRNHRASFLRVLRVMGAMMAVLLPGVYVAMQEYHYHLLPLKFLISILNNINGIPFTPPMEMLFVLILFEILYQASVRMPRYVGVALSIVGAIVLGETAVNAGLISSPSVLIVSISAIGINCVPEITDTLSILRLAILIAGSVMGLFGILLVSFFIVVYLASMQSYGTPYLSPYAPIIPSDLKDAVIKANLLEMKDRPRSVATKNRRRLRRNG